MNGILEVFSIDGLPDQDLFPLVELMGNTVAVPWAHHFFVVID